MTIVHRREELRASKIMQDRAKANPKVHFIWNKVVTEVLGDTKVEGLKLRDVHTSEEEVLPVTGLFVAIGHAPNTDIVRDQLGVGRDGLCDYGPGDHGYERRRGLCGGGRGRPSVPSGGYGRRQRLHVSHRRRALARRARHDLKQRAARPGHGF